MSKLHRHLEPPQELILVRLLVMMGSATVAASSSLYLSSLGLSDGTIGVATGLVMAVSLVFSLFLPRLLPLLPLSKILSGSILAFAFAIVLFGTIPVALVAILIYIVLRMLLALFSSSFSILFHDDSPSEASYKRNQALSGSIVNFSWMTTPFVATLVISQYSFAVLYILGAIVVMLAAIILLMQRVPEPVHKKPKHGISLIGNIRSYFSKKHLRDAYMVNAGVDVWWAFVFTFVTLFMIESGYSTAAIGLFLTLTQLPLFLFEFKTNILVEKFGYRGPFVLCFGLLGAIMLALAVLGISTLSLFILVLGSLLNVYLEPAREMFLYEKLKNSDEENVQPVYMTAEMTGSMVLRISVGIILILSSSTVSFVFVALIMGALSWHLRNVKN